MSYKIGSHDYDVRVKSATKFIKQGNRVKLTIMFKGREVQHDKLGYDLLNRAVEDMSKIVIMDTKPRRVGMSLICFISPRPEVTKAINEKKRSEEKAARKRKEASYRVTEEITADTVRSAQFVFKEDEEVMDDDNKKNDEFDEVSLHKMFKSDTAVVDIDEDDTNDELSLKVKGDELISDLFG